MKKILSILLLAFSAVSVFALNVELDVGATVNPLSKVSGEVESARGVYTTHSDESKHILWDWYGKRDWNRYGGDCGSNCIAFIMVGLGTNSGYASVPLNGGSHVKDYYNEIEKQIGKGPNLPSHLSHKLSDFTQNRYRLSSTSVSFSSMYSHMRGNNLPGISLRGSRSPSSYEFHYRTIVGGKREKAKLILKVFRKKKTLKTWYDDFYYLHDNGADGRDFFENAHKWYDIAVYKVVRN